jgi:hypothetical protein
VGALGGGPVDRHPAAIFTPWARPESCRFLRLDLLHAIMNRFPVVGDWFRHLSVPPGFAAFFQRRGYQLRTRLPCPGGRIDTPELNGFRYAGRLRFRPRASLQHEQAHQSTQVRLFLRSGGRLITSRQKPKPVRSGCVRSAGAGSCSKSERWRIVVRTPMVRARSVLPLTRSRITARSVLAVISSLLPILASARLNYPDSTSQH